MALLALDIGTTHCKAGIFDTGGALLAGAGLATPTRQAQYRYYDPEQLWRTVLDVAAQALERAGRPAIKAIGVAGMAETGMLLDRRSGAARSPLLPWFDTAAAAHAGHLEHAAPAFERFARFGIYPSFKVSLAKLLWWREREPRAVEGAVWLSAPDYIVYRLTGAAATDYSLAGRTYAFDLNRRAWDGAWLAHWGLPDDMFAPAGPAIRAVGELARAAGLAVDGAVPVAVAGHDHICAAFAAGAGTQGPAFDSMGTAEALLGGLPPRALGRPEYKSGLSFGLLSDGDGMYWLGGLSSSGGALEWLRGVLGEPPLDYRALVALAEQGGDEPGDLLFMPYLAGAGAPRPDPGLRGALLGLDARHGRADIVRAVLEGTAYQMEAIRRAAAAVGEPIARISTAGGGTRHRRWLQIKADVYGMSIDALDLDEATLLGAALLAGVAGGVYGDLSQARGVAAGLGSTTFEPHPGHHAAYRRKFEAFERWMTLLAETQQL